MSIPTESAAGKAWVEKYLHPPSVPRSSYAGTPDNNMSPITSLEFETVNNIPTVFTVGAVTYQASEMFFLQTTGASVVAYVFVRCPTYLKNEWSQHPQYPAIVNDSYDFLQNWGSDVSMQRMAYKSCTYFLNATAFNDQGTVTIAQARPAFFTFSGGKIPPESPYLTDDSFEVLPTKPHRRIDGEFDYNSQILDMGDVSGPGFTGAYMPSTPTQVQQSNPKAVTHMAREGAFVTQHWSQPTNRFWNNTDIGNGSQFDLVQTWLRFIQDDHSEHSIRLYTKFENGAIPEKPTLLNAADTVWTDFTVAYVYFSGLTVGGTTNAVGNAYITVKSMYCIEVQPHLKSSFVFFQNSPPVPDDRAIHVASAVTHQVPDGFPASANSFASILGLVAQYAPTVVNWINNAFKANAPAEKAVEKVVEKVVKEKPLIKRPPAKTKPAPAKPFSKPKPSANMQLRIKDLERQLAQNRVSKAMSTGRYTSANNTKRTPYPYAGSTRPPTPMQSFKNNTPRRRFSTRL